MSVRLPEKRVHVAAKRLPHPDTKLKKKKKTLSKLLLVQTFHHLDKLCFVCHTKKLTRNLYTNEITKL